MGEQPHSVVDVLVEVPMGSRNKYEWDAAAGAFRLDRMLFTAVRYPGDYGYLPRTLARDGDELDALVILGEPTFPGCLIDGRVVGVLFMSDEKGPDEKLLCVPHRDPRWLEIEELDDVPDHLLSEIAHFFGIYKELERKQVSIGGWGDRAAALEVLDDSLQRYA